MIAQSSFEHQLSSTGSALLPVTDPDDPSATSSRTPNIIYVISYSPNSSGSSDIAAGSLRQLQRTCRVGNMPPWRFATPIHGWAIFEIGFDLPAAEDETRFPTEFAEAQEELTDYLQSIDESELEDGETSRIGITLLKLSEMYGESFFIAFSELLSQEVIPDRTLSHALRWLGRMRSLKSFGRRLWILEMALRSRIPIVRDGAALGLGLLGSALAEPALLAAINREELRGLRENMRQILDRIRTQSQDIGAAGE